jgi:hypothetical protein
MDWMSVLWSALAGAGVLFVWGAMCWIVLPHHFGDWSRLGNEEEVDRALSAAPPPPGLYMLPHWGPYPQGMKDKAYRERFLRGPNAHIHVLRDCFENPGTFLRGFLLNLAVAFVAAYLLQRGFLGVTGLAHTVLLFALLGALVHGVHASQHAIWMGYPWRPVVTGLFDGIVGWSLLGLVLHLLR